MEAFAAAAAAAGVFAGAGAAARPVLLRRRGAPRSSRVRLLRAPPRAGGDRGGDLPPLDEWDRMELEFGRFLGEDPKLSLAKVSFLPCACLTTALISSLERVEALGIRWKCRLVFFKKFNANSYLR